MNGKRKQPKKDDVNVVYAFNEKELKQKFGILYLVATIVTLVSSLKEFLPLGVEKFFPLIIAATLIFFAFTLLKKYRYTAITIVSLIAIWNILTGFNIISYTDYKCSNKIKKAELLIDSLKYNDALQLLTNSGTEKYCKECENNRNAEWLLLTGQALWRNGKLEDALQLTNESLKKTTENNSRLLAKIYKTIGNIQSEMGNYNIAESFFKQAIEKGLNDDGMLIDLSIAQTNLGRMDTSLVKKVVSNNLAAKTVRQKIILTQAYRLLARNARNCIGKIEFYKLAFNSLSDDPVFSERKLLSFVDWIENRNKCKECKDKPDLDSAYLMAQAILNNSPPKADLDRAKVDLGIKFCIMFKDKADIADTSLYKSYIDKALNILNSVADIVDKMNTNPQMKLKWYLQNIDLCSRMENYKDLILALENANNIAKNLSTFEKRDISALSEFYQVQGLIHYYYKNVPQVNANMDFAKESLFKSYCFKYLFEGKLLDFRRVQAVLDSLGIKGLPVNFPASM
jgi:hypothetical protein